MDTGCITSGSTTLTEGMRVFYSHNVQVEFMHYTTHVVSQKDDYRS